MKKIFIGVGLISLFSGSIAGCGYETDEERCCECLVEKGCTTVSKNRCLDTFYVFQGVDSIPTDGDCVGENNCYLPCAMGGAYFEENRMVVDYWKKKSLEGE